MKFSNNDNYIIKWAICLTHMMNNSIYKNSLNINKSN